MNIQLLLKQNNRQGGARAADYPVHALRGGGVKRFTPKRVQNVFIQNNFFVFEHFFGGGAGPRAPWARHHCKKHIRANKRHSNLISATERG